MRLRMDAQDDTIKSLSLWCAELHEAFAQTVSQTGTITYQADDGKGGTVQTTVDTAAPFNSSPLASEGERERRKDAIEAQLEDAKREGQKFSPRTDPGLVAAAAEAAP